MKSLFSRLRHSKDATPPSRPSSSASINNGKQSPQPPTSRSSSYSEQREGNRRSSTPIAALHSQSSSSSSDSSRPRSVLGIPGGDEFSMPDIVDPDGDLTVRGRTMSGNEVHVKKVTFRSPVPTPTTSLVLDDIAPLMTTGDQSSGSSQRRTSSSPSKKPSSSMMGADRPASAQSRSASKQSLPLRLKPIMTRNSSLPTTSSTPSNPSPTKSMMSPTPSEQSMGGTSARSYLPPPNSWSEMAEDELIANLGPRERTRQEVLWEIVSSEERYVQELIKLNETFCHALLPPSATSPALHLFDHSATLSRTLSFNASTPTSPTDSVEYLPIAAQYSSGTTSPPTMSSARLNAYHTLTNGRPSDEPSRKPSSTSLNNGPRSHRSLPPPKRDGIAASSSHHRMSFHPGGNRLHKNDSRVSSGGSTSSIRSGLGPLPEDLERVLTVLAGGILEGHIKLAAALRKRYENQYPLVRSLADVFTSHSYILREYATYVLHLEKALEQVESALSAYTASHSKRSSRHLENTDLGRLGRTLLSLEELAVERGESGLSISLSKPFQRLLKYPLLFQNLLFNTDPSLKEYEATLSMVDEVEEIVRTIEDEKASSEERERTRDVWARIDGLESDKILMAPKPNRLLISESQVVQTEDKEKDATKHRKSLRRLSDILKGHGDAVDLWIVRFSDVSLLCERTGLTHLPASNTKGKKAASRSDSLPELSGRTKYATTGRRGGSIKARNLYRFVKVHEWQLTPKSGSTDALLSMDDISRARSRISEAPKDLPTIPANPASPPDTPQKPVTVPMKGDGGPSPSRSTLIKKEADTETMVSDRLSVMSFAFKGSDQIKPNPRRTRPSIPPPSNTAARVAITTANGGPAQRRISGGHMTGKEANAKFAHRLRSDDQGINGDVTIRPVSRTRRSLPPAMALRAGRASPVLHPTDRNASTTRPGSTDPKSPKGNNDKSSPPNSPSMSSVRGVKGTTVQRPGQTLSSVGTKRMVPKKPGNVATRPSISDDSGVAGLWNVYNEGGAVGTPARAIPGARQMGGRI